MTSQSANMLVVEDDAEMWVTLASILDNQEHRVTAFQSGKKDAEIIKQANLDVDLRLPDLTVFSFWKPSRKSSLRHCG